MGKRRIRISKVCDFCKKRKVKCDLGNPCSTCVKYRKGEPCTYTEYNAHLKANGLSNSKEEEIAEELDVRMHSSDSNNTNNSFNNLATNETTTELDTISETLVQDELQFLKEKLKSLEQSLQRRSVDNSPTNEFQLANPSSGLSSSFSPLPPSVPIPSNNMQHPPNTFDTARALDITKLIGFNPVESQTETINFYDGYSPTYDKEPIRRRNFGPLSWISLTRMDGALGALWSQFNSIKEQYKGKMMFNTVSTSLPVEKEFSAKVNDDEGLNDVRPYRETVQQNNNKDKKQNVPLTPEKLNEKALSIGLSFYQGGLDEEMELVEKIKLVLPKQKVIWLLYKRFFTHLYVAFPFLDEVIFKEQLQKLIGYEDYFDVPITVKVEKKMDFAYLGILLIVLRLSYLSLFSNDSKVNEANMQTNDPSPKAQQIKYLLNNPINIDAIDVSQSCLNQFNLMRSINMTLMQLALFTRLYHSLAPEDGDGINGGDAQVFNAILVQMAYTLGLHREPDNFPDTCNDEKVNNLGRKIWTFLLITDLNFAMANGTMLNVDKDSFDTKAPFYKPGNENVIDVEMEKLTMKCFNQFDISYQPLHELLTQIMKVKGSTNMAELATKLNYLESHFVDKFGDMLERIDMMKSTNQEVFPRTLKMKIYCTGNFLMVSIYLHIFNYYERKGSTDLAYYYLKKIFVVVILDLMPFFCECVNDIHMMVSRDSTDLVIIPAYETLAHKSLLVIMAVFLRFKFAILNLQSKYNHGPLMKGNDKYRVHYQRLLNISELLLRSRDVFREGAAKLSHRYYYAWRITKAQNFLSNVLTKDDFFKNFKPLHESAILQNDQMLEELEFILESSLAKVKEAKKRPKHPVYANYSYQDFATKRYSTTPLFDTASTTSSDVDTNDYRPNEQVDSIWLQMMNMKNEYGDPGSKFGFTGNIGVGGTLNQQPMEPTSMYNDATLLNQLDGNIIGTGLTPGNAFSPGIPMNLTSTNDLFENYPIDELFKDFS